MLRILDIEQEEKDRGVFLMTEEPKKYKDPKRRKSDRRQANRRGEIRFEPGKEDRRKTRGRRSTDRDPWH